MNLTRRHKHQLRFWKKFHGVSKPTVFDFLRAQRPLWWIAMAVFIGVFVAYELAYGNPEFIKGFAYATFVYFGAMYIRFRLDWSFLNHYLNWKKIEQAQQDAPPDARNDGARPRASR